MTVEPGPAWPGPGAAGRALENRERKAARGRACMARSAGIVMARTVAGFVAGETRIDRAEAVDASYPRFFQEMAGLGARVSVG